MTGDEVGIVHMQQGDCGATLTFQRNPAFPSDFDTGGSVEADA